MHVGVGYCDNPDSAAAGVRAAQRAREQAGQSRSCDLVLLFATAQHDARLLRDAVASVLGSTAVIVGGGAIGAISNDDFGYAGDQVGLAAFWLDDIRCDLAIEGGMNLAEEETGKLLGQKLAGLGVRPESPVMLFYDAIDRSGGGMRLLMATPLLKGMAGGLGFLPDGLVGGGLMGDYICTPTKQWIGSEIVQYHAMALAFGGDLRLDSLILHGCRPASGYYTVTRAENQTILEINGQPALPFLQNLLGPAISPEEYAFFLILGINSGEKWGPFDEKSYANRLCLTVDRSRNGIVMFEPDMVEGTRFQIMHRNMDVTFMEPQIEALFDGLRGRRPVFSFFIDCAGRAAGYAGIDLEDAVMVQKAVAGRAPLLGIYSGVEIAPVLGKPRALDWTGVFCLMSVPE